MHFVRRGRPLTAGLHGLDNGLAIAARKDLVAVHRVWSGAFRVWKCFSVSTFDIVLQTNTHAYFVNVSMTQRRYRQPCAPRKSIRAQLLGCDFCMIGFEPAAFVSRPDRPVVWLLGKYLLVVAFVALELIASVFEER